VVPPDPVTGVKEVAAWLTVSVTLAIDWVAATALLTVRLKVAVELAMFASVTVTVYVVAAMVTVGVPVMAPVVDEILRPAGSEGLTLKLSGAVPPDPVTGVNEVAAWLTVSVVLATDWLADTALLTVRLKVAIAVALLVSVTVTV